MRVALLLVCMLGATARADDEPWYRGEHGTNRILHLSITAVGFVAYPFAEPIEFGVECRWCGGPSAIDRGVRDALVWSIDDKSTAAQLSDLTSYVLAPTAALTGVIVGSLRDRSWAHFIDDVVPVVETVVITQWVTRFVKISAARTRPYARFTDMRDPEEDHLSFFSGHTSRAFAAATSAAMIARARGYRSEPYIWGAGLTLGVATAYFRLAADRHYVSDVLVGATVGVAAGLTVPLLMRRANVEVTPTGNGIAVAGAW